MKKIILVLVFIAALVVGAVFYFRYQVYFSHGSYQQSKMFEIVKGDGNATVGKNLQASGLISGKWYFYYYVRTHGFLNKIMPGEYQLNGNMTIPEIAVTITQEKKSFIKITFPEGWTAKQMGDRLTANGLDGENFLKLTKTPEIFKEKYGILADIPKGGTLEGYLFPDTYFFSKDATAEGIINKMMDNFDQKLSSDLRQEIKNQNKTINEIMTMASIVEMEVKTDEDRALVSGIYWSRIKSGQRLQSDITIAYVLGEKKKQYSFDDTRIVSPYNTYLNLGLPPGPIDNPGISAIKAAIYPKLSGYVYYLSDPNTGQTIFSKTIDEHNANKVKYGL